MSVMMAALLALSAAEDAKVEVKVYVKGMSCEVNCGAKVQKSLAALPGVKEAKLAKFDEGLFTVAVDAKSAVKPSEIKKAVAGYEIVKIVATLSGTVAKADGKFVLTTASGAKYAVSAADKEECAKAAKPGEAAACPIGALDKLVADGKTTVSVTGLLDECCQGAMSIAALKVSACCPSQTGAN
jgi:copper chaperone CopZ